MFALDITLFAIRKRKFCAKGSVFMMKLMTMNIMLLVILSGMRVVFHWVMAGMLATLLD
jgi:hypothetical protein